MADMLEELIEVNSEKLDKQARELFECIMNVINERDKYKKLYENEKDHTDTLGRIIVELKKGN